MVAEDEELFHELVGEEVDRVSGVSSLSASPLRSSSQTCTGSSGTTWVVLHAQEVAGSSPDLKRVSRVWRIQPGKKARW
jgi:hypothetical protein